MSKVKLTTNHGDIVLQLNAEKAPITVANFIEYVNAGHYSNTVGATRCSVKWSKVRTWSTKSKASPLLPRPVTRTFPPKT